MSDWNTNVINEFRAKGGKGVGHFGDGLLLLTVRGAKSGIERTYPLAYHRDGDNYVVIASKGGAPTNPQWYGNIVAQGQAEIEVGAERFPVRATPIPSGPERDRLYAQQGAIMPGFLEYEKNTDRIIPVVVLGRLTEAKAA